MAQAPKSRTRSAITGQYVKKSYAVKHPKTTVRETTKVVKKASK